MVYVYFQSVKVGVTMRLRAIDTCFYVVIHCDMFQSDDDYNQPTQFNLSFECDTTYIVSVFARSNMA